MEQSLNNVLENDYFFYHVPKTGTEFQFSDEIEPKKFNRGVLKGGSFGGSTLPLFWKNFSIC